MQKYRKYEITINEVNETFGIFNGFFNDSKF